ncbi:MAG: hypothetical protein Q4E17_05915 [Synergistes sp.]|nr:hypothetical protein [Synergistes sp.]
MEHIAEFIIRIAELAEAEGRELKNNICSVLRSAMLTFFAFQLFFAGVLALLFAFYLLIVGIVGRPAAALIIALLFFAIGWLLLKAANTKNNEHQKKLYESEDATSVGKIAE